MSKSFFFFFFSGRFSQNVTQVMNVVRLSQYHNASRNNFWVLALPDSSKAFLLDMWLQSWVLQGRKGLHSLMDTLTVGT